MEVLPTDGDITIILMNQLLSLANSVKFNILKQFSVPLVIGLVINFVANVLTGGQEE